MAVYIKEDSEQVTKKMVKIPKKEVEQARDIVQMIDASNGNDRKANGKTALDGYKTMKGIADKGDYNNFSSKQTTDDGGVLVPFGKAKKQLFHMQHMSHDPNNITYQINGGDEMLNTLKGEVNRVRRSVKTNPIVKQVKPTTPKIQSVSDSQKDSVKVDKPNLHVVGENKRKIYLDESQLSLIAEDYHQLTIPFDGRYNVVNNHVVPAKYNYEQFLDWLQHIGQNGTLPSSNFDYKSVCKLEQEELAKIDTETIVDELLDFDEFNNEDEIMDEIARMNNISNTEEVYDLDPQLLKKSVERLLNSRINLCYNVNDKGHIEIERMICVPKALEKRVDTRYSQESYFDYLMDMFGDRIGVYWAWTNSHSYCGITYKDIGNDNFILYGEVNPTDIDWKGTFKTNFDYNSREYEIRLRPTAQVQINKIELFGNNSQNKILPLKSPIIIKA